MLETRVSPILEKLKIVENSITVISSPKLCAAHAKLKVILQSIHRDTSIHYIKSSNDHYYIINPFS